MDIINRFLVWIDTIIYRFVGWLYQLYFAISSARIVRDDIFELFIQRIYIILGIAMLFFLAYSVLLLIVDPNKSINGGGYSMGKIASNTIISIVIIAVVPTCFNFIYKAQEILLTENIIGKMVLGGTSSNSSNLKVIFNNEDCQKISQIDPEGNLEGCDVIYEASEDNLSMEFAGNSVAVDIYSSFIYPNMVSSANDDGTQYSEAEYYSKVYTYNELKSAGLDFSDQDKYLFRKVEAYNNCHGNSSENAGQLSYIYGSAANKCAMDMLAMHSEDKVENMGIEYSSILQYVKTTGDFGAFSLLATTIDSNQTIYSAIVSLIAGGFLCYVFISYCLDMGLRAVKLAFAQLIAPVPVFARIIPQKSDMFGRWIKFTTSAFFEVFLRLFIIFLGIFLINNLPENTQLWEDTIFGLAVPTLSLETPLIAQIAASFGIISFARAFVIIGILMFVKQAPNIIQESLGIHANIGGLSIKNKLNGMLGMQTLNKVGGAALGAVTGGIGAGFMAKKNGGQFLRSALIGGRQGFKAGGNQFRAQGQRAYREVTGDRYNGSFIRRGRSFTGNLEFQYDRQNRINRDNIRNRHEDIVRDFENSQEYKDIVAQQETRRQRVINSVENSQEFNDYMNNETGLSQAVNDLRAQTARQQQETANNLAQKLQDIRTQNDEEEKRATRDMEAYKQAYQGTYRIAETAAKNYAEAQKRLAIQNGITDAAQLDSIYNSAKNTRLAEEILRRDDSQTAQQFAKDVVRDFNAELQTQIKAVQDEADKTQQELQDKLQKDIETATNAAREDTQNYFKSINREYKEVVDNSAEKLAQRTIKNNPGSRRQQEYVNSKSEVGSLQEAERDRNMRRALGDFFNNNNNNNGNSS